MKYAVALLLVAAIALDVFRPEAHVALFILAVLAIVPLAGYIGQATDTLTEHLGSGIGGLLNAAFGNAAELIIGAMALRQGLPDLVKASLTGSIIGNILLVFGLSAFVGGLRHPVQRFNRTAASLGATMLLLSVIGLVVPAVFHWLSRGNPDAPELQLDTEIAIVLLVTYSISLIFTLRTHREHYGAVPEGSPHRGDRRDMRRAVRMLVLATTGVAIASEILVGSVSAAAEALGFSQLFIGVIVVAIVGNAAEHYSAVTLAAQDKMDASLAIAVGSSMQIALFVAPLLLLLSYVIAPRPMDLLFSVFEIVAIGLAVLSISFIAHDGETHWMEGVQLLAVYTILAMGFFFL